jgi:DNA-binding transcriptional LysR family regulator
MPVFEELATKLPGFELSLVEASNAGLCDFLLHGTLDAAVLIGPSALPERLNRWALLTHASTLIMSHGHKLAAADPCSLAMLDGVPVVCRGSDCVLAGLLETAEQRHGARPAARHRADSAGGVIELVRAGLGVAAWSEVDPVPDGLCTRRLEPPATHAIVLAAVAGRPLGRAPDAFIKLARARDWTGCRERGHGIVAPFRQHVLAATG